MDQRDIAKKLVGELNEPVKSTPKKVKEANTESFRRSIGVIGLGDGGCKIASDINANIADVRTMGYNLSKRNEDLFNVEKFISAQGEDGSGQNRKYAKSIVSKTEVLTPIVQEALKMRTDMFICTQTAGGGTGCGSGPKVAITIADELLESKVKGDVDKPVIIVGVYPKPVDQPSIFNTLEWQTEVEKIELPYMIFNNARVNAASIKTHEEVNTEIIRAVEVLAGGTFEKSDIHSMDSKDFMNILNRPGRVNVYYSKKRPRMNETFDQFLMDLIKESTQEPPLLPEAQGILIKGPIEMIKNIDDSLALINESFGEPILKFKHIEESETVEIAFVTSGSKRPVNAIEILKARYAEIEYSRETKDVDPLVNDIEDPFKNDNKRKRGNLI